MKSCFNTKILLFCIALNPLTILAQENKKDDTLSQKAGLETSKDALLKKDIVQQKDLSDVISSVFKKQLPLMQRNHTAVTAKPVYSVVAAVGYTLQTRLAATISGNVVFRPDTATKLSTVTSNATYTQNKQFYMPVQSNIWTRNNKYNFIDDFRFYKYPQSTFGLGSGSYIKSEDPMRYNFFRFYEIVQRKIRGNLYGGFGYIFDYRWDISHKGTKNGDKSDYAVYGVSNHTLSSGITLNAVYDTRNNPINTGKGFYTSLQLRNNLKAIGSNSNWRSLIIDIRKYFTLPGSSENVLAFWSYNWLILNGKPPYLDLPSNGWDSYSCTGRGYIQGRFRGAQMLYMESEYRFKITANGLFGGVAFANGETFSARPGSALQTIQPGFGAGIRIKVKKESKTNLSIDYGFGTQGSKGLFINIGEYF